METMNFQYAATKAVVRRAHVGVVGSGDLEILLEPTKGEYAHVAVRTRFDGYKEIWKSILDKFFDTNDIIVDIKINDFGATPGMVSMRLLQALEVCTSEKDEG